MVTGCNMPKFSLGLYSVFQTQQFQGVVARQTSLPFTHNNTAVPMIRRLSDGEDFILNKLIHPSILIGGRHAQYYSTYPADGCGRYSPGIRIDVLSLLILTHTHVKDKVHTFIYNTCYFANMFDEKESRDVTKHQCENPPPKKSSVRPKILSQHFQHDRLWRRNSLRSYAFTTEIWPCEEDHSKCDETSRHGRTS